MTASPTYGELTNKGASTNIAWHEASVGRDERSKQRGHRSAILWFTGLSGSGKSTLANAVNAALFERGLATYVLDGDNIRHGLCKDLGFSDADREENIRRIGEVAKLFLDAGVIVLTAFVSALRADRDKARDLVEDGVDFLEVFCAADARGLRIPRPQRPLRQGTGGADQGIHRHLQPLRSTGNARTEDRHRQAGSGRLRGAGDQSAPGAWPFRPPEVAVASPGGIRQGLMQLATGTANSRPSRSPTP